MLFIIVLSFYYLLYMFLDKGKDAENLRTEFFYFILLFSPSISNLKMLLFNITDIVICLLLIWFDLLGFYLHL